MCVFWFGLWLLFFFFLVFLLVYIFSVAKQYSTLNLFTMYEKVAQGTHHNVCLSNNNLYQFVLPLIKPLFHCLFGT